MIKFAPLLLAALLGGTPTLSSTQLRLDTNDSTTTQVISIPPAEQLPSEIRVHLDALGISKLRYENTNNNPVNLTADYLFTFNLVLQNGMPVYDTSATQSFAAPMAAGEELNFAGAAIFDDTVLVITDVRLMAMFVGKEDINLTYIFDSDVSLSLTGSFSFLSSTGVGSGGNLAPRLTVEYLY